MPTPTDATPWFAMPNAPAPGSLVGALSAFADGQATMVEVATPAFKLLVLRDGERVHAFANACSHFGVPLAAQQARLIFQPLKSLTCNVHYARYNWASGACEAGECNGESLSPVPLELGTDGQVRIGSHADAV